MLTTASGLCTPLWALFGCTNPLFTLPQDGVAAPSLLPGEVPASPVSGAVPAGTPAAECLGFFFLLLSCPGAACLLQIVPVAPF